MIYDNQNEAENKIAQGLAVLFFINGEQYLH